MNLHIRYRMHIAFPFKLRSVVIPILPARIYTLHESAYSLSRIRLPLQRPRLRLHLRLPIPPREIICVRYHKFRIFSTCSDACSRHYMYSYFVFTLPLRNLPSYKNASCGISLIILSSVLQASDFQRYLKPWVSSSARLYKRFISFTALR